MKNKTQKKHRFNIIDFALIVTVIACLIGIAVRYNLGASVLQSSDTATVTVMIRNLLDDNADQLVVGDKFYYQKSGDLLGTLRSFETSPAHIPNFRLDGTFVEVPYLDRVDVICEIEVEGLLTDDGFMVGGSDYIGCGSSILVRSLNLETEWLVLDIEVSGT